jgi:hypothetical protein
MSTDDTDLDYDTAIDYDEDDSGPFPEPEGNDPYEDVEDPDFVEQDED